MKKTALVVDNDFFFVEFLTELLEGRGYEVQKAYDGKEAILGLKDHPVDLVFIDNVMPKIDGRQLIEFIRTADPGKHFPLVLVSSTVVEQWDTINTFGADFYIAKGPIDKMEEKIHYFLDRFEQEGGLPFDSRDSVIEPSNIYPRQTTSELIDRLNFERGITESIGLGIIVIDKDAKVMRASARALKILGTSVTDTLGTHIGVLFSGGAGRRIIEILKSILIDQDRTCIRFYITLRDKTIRAYASLFRVEGVISGWTLALEDQPA